MELKVDFTLKVNIFYENIYGLFIYNKRHL
jgi:hypothetical protein